MWPFKKKTKKLQLTGITYPPCNGWGDSIEWSDFASRRIVGWQTRKPEVGDEIHKNMASGKVARFAVISVEYCGDPADMFFADVADIGYVGEPSINSSIIEAESYQTVWEYLKSQSPSGVVLL
jgi:hypothetical protein